MLLHGLRIRKAVLYVKVILGRLGVEEANLWVSFSVAHSLTQ